MARLYDLCSQWPEIPKKMVSETKIQYTMQKKAAEAIVP
jgi:hypothetical protein